MILIIVSMIYVMRFGFLVLKLTCKKPLCQDNIVPARNDYVKEAHTEVRYYCTYGEVWENLSMAQSVN